MGHRTISVTDKAYEALTRLKREDESFSDMFLRLYQEEDSLTILKKLHGTIDIPDKDQLIDEIYRKRREPHDSP